MNRINTLILLFVAFSLNSNATTYTSNQNGNWNDLFIWTPAGIPSSAGGDTIIINHNVTLNVPLFFLSGSIIVNASGSLVEDVSGTRYIHFDQPASLINHGTITVNLLSLVDGDATNNGNLNVDIIYNGGGLINNTGTINDVDSLYNNDIFNNNGVINVQTFFNNDQMNNYGTIQGLVGVVDSMFNAGTFLNDFGAIINADSCTNSNQFTNNGIINLDQFTNIGTFTNTNYMSFGDMTNIGTYTNQDSLIGGGSVTNIGNLDIQAGSIFNLAISYLNYDPVGNNALLTINGIFNIGDSYYNFNTVNGSTTGTITVQDTSYNHTTGTMTGSFDFCDATPPATSPFIDFNFGTVDPTITYCTVSIEENLLSNNITIYPNPTNGIINVNINESITIEVFNMLGEQVLVTQQNQVDLSNYENGVYLFRIKDREGKMLSQERTIKQ